jgi:hypothetical protein
MTGLCTAGLCNQPELTRRIVSDRKLCQAEAGVPEVSVGPLSQAICAAAGGTQLVIGGDCFLPVCPCSSENAKALLMPSGPCHDNKAGIQVTMSHIPNAACSGLGGVALPGEQCRLSLCVQK